MYSKVFSVFFLIAKLSTLSSLTTFYSSLYPPQWLNTGFFPISIRHFCNIWKILREIKHTCVAAGGGRNEESFYSSLTMETLDWFGEHSLVDRILGCRPEQTSWNTTCQVHSIAPFIFISTGLFVEMFAFHRSEEWKAIQHHIQSNKTIWEMSVFVCDLRNNKDCVHMAWDWVCVCLCEIATDLKDWNLLQIKGRKTKRNQMDN